MSEEQAQQLMYQMQMLESYLNDLANRESTLMTVLREAVSAIESIKALKDNPNSNTLIPLGMGTFAKSQISSKEKIVLNIGAGVAIEKEPDAAINFLESRIKEVEVALQDTAAKKQDAVARLEQGKQEINRMMQSQQPST